MCNNYNTCGYGGDYIWIILIVFVLLFCTGTFNTGGNCNPCC